MPIRPWIRHTALATAALLSLAAAGAATAVWLGHRKLDRQVPTPALTEWAVPSDAAAVTRGAYLYASRGCADCHGANGAGRAFINDPNGFYLKAPNISPGPGSVAASYRAQDWTRLLRHRSARNHARHLARLGCRQSRPVGPHRSSCPP